MAEVREAAGLARVEPAALSMLTLRADLSAPETAAAVQAAVGQGVPGPRGLHLRDGRGVAWMAPDELLLILPIGAGAGALAAARAALGDGFATLVDVSDARAAFRLSGPRADEVVMKLAPVDILRFPEGEIRRTRAGQVAAAFWRSGPQEITLVCFRSVADYMRELLTAAAAPGGEIFP
jgi:sarcosine oxidase subunit gamma